MSDHKKVQESPELVDQAGKNWDAFVVGSKITLAIVCAILGFMAVFLA